METPYKRPSSNVVCFQCKKEFEKENREISRAKRENKEHFCSRKCVGIYGSYISNGEKEPMKHYITQSKKTANRKGLDFNLTVEYLKELFDNQDGLCSLSGLQMVLKNRGNKKNLDQASIDRIDNNKGYIKGNVQFVTLGMNYMRNTLSIKEVLVFIKKLKTSP